MLHDEKLNALFPLLKEMTIPAKRADAPFSSSRAMQRIESWLMIGFIATMLVLVAVAAWYRFASPKPVNGLPGLVAVIYLISMLLAFLYLVTATVDVVGKVWRYRHERFPAILRPLESDLIVDAHFLARLWAFDKPTLEYAMIQYRNHWGMSDKRLGSLAGDIRKIGLFPALTAAAMTAATLMKDGNNVLFWAPLILTCCFYLLGFIVVNQRERAEQVITLLEYAVTYAGEPTKATRPARPDKATPAFAAQPNAASPATA